MTVIANATLLAPQSEQDETFQDLYLTLTHVWGNVTGILTMEPEGYLQYDLLHTLREAETYIRTGLCSCNRCAKQTFRRQEINFNRHCPTCAQEASERRDSRMEWFRQRYPDMSFPGHKT